MTSLVLAGLPDTYIGMPGSIFRPPGPKNKPAVATYG